MDTVPERFNLAAYCLSSGADGHPDKPALVIADAEGERSLSFGELDLRVRQAAQGFRDLGLDVGDRVMLRLPSNDAYAVNLLGAIAAGLVAVPSTDRLTPREAGVLAVDSGARIIVKEPWCRAPDTHAPHATFVDGTVAAAIGQASDKPLGYASTAADDPAFLVYTSGTTGRPKGVLHAHRAAWGRRPMRAGWTGIGPDDVVLHAGRLNWTYALGIALIDTLSVGATAVLWSGEHEPAVWPRLCREHRATVFAAVPTVYRQILKYGEDVHDAFATLRHGLTAGEPLPGPVLDGWTEITGKPLYEALGMSEISTYVSSGPDTPTRPGSPGRPQQGRRVAVLRVDGGDQPLPSGETGLLAVHRSDPGLMLGYWKRDDEETAVFRGDWFVGGDLAEVDYDGYVWFHGRNDDLMNAFGHRVSPLEVEPVVRSHPRVVECAVAERQVRQDVSVICAYVVTDGGRVTEGELLAWCETRIADYKRPRAVVFTDALPRGRNGKLSRRELAAVRTPG